MQAKSFVIPAALGLLVGCGAPTEMSDMRAAMDNRLALGTTETQGEDGKPMVLQAGFAPSLRAAVIANEGYLGALALEAEAMGQVGVLQSVRRPQLTGNANIGALREIGANGSTTTGVAGGINLSQLVYDGGASTSAINQLPVAISSSNCPGPQPAKPSNNFNFASSETNNLSSLSWSLVMCKPSMQSSEPSSG